MDNEIELPIGFWSLRRSSVVGAAAGKFSFDLETANGFFHYAFYVAVTMILGAIAGLGWAWQ